MRKLIFIMILLGSIDSKAQEQLSDSGQNEMEIENSGSINTLIGTEKMPEFPGGEEAMFRFLGENMNYPEQAIVNEVEGVIHVKFDVDTTGEIKYIRIAGSKRQGFGLEEEAIRVVKLMPKWKPGLQNGKPITMTVTIPIKFKLG